ncbi:MAG: A24 family peptidase [Chloroflexota bacterium]|jgi:leader peptidase (prepilin peptidase) / N-methyltransferase
MIFQHLLFLLLGFLVGIIINSLADTLPQRRGLKPPHCPHCDYRYPVAQRSVTLRLLLGVRQCPQCGQPVALRGPLVEGSTALIFALLPALFSNWPNLLINALYIAVLILIIVIDLEHRLILDVVTLPMTGLALLFSLALTSDQNTIGLAVVGAVTGFVLFYFAYWIGQIMFGPGALGFGDVKLALLMGAMLGFHRIIFALILGILLGGLISALLLASRRFSRNQFLPYGQYLALAGIVMILWGVQIVNWYIG